MIDTAQLTTTPTTRAPRPGRRDISARLAGTGGIVFVLTVIAQNVIRGATAPGNGASARDVLTHYADHRAVTYVLAATFVLSGIGLATFLGGAMRHLLAGDRRGWALAGLAGGIGIMVLFSVLVGTEQSLSVAAGLDHPHVSAIEALWALHNSVFTVLFLSIAVALLGLSRAGVAAGITPPAFERLGPVGSALLLVGVIAGPSIAIGDSMPLFGVAAVGFLIWLAFLVTTGLRLVRARTS